LKEPFKVYSILPATSSVPNSACVPKDLSVSPLFTASKIQKTKISHAYLQLVSLENCLYKAKCAATIVRTYGHFASIIPVLYVFGHLQKNTSKIRPIFKVEGHGSNF
jgi:hypothetical protein